jgi:hypothetical protein
VGIVRLATSTRRKVAVVLLSVVAIGCTTTDGGFFGDPTPAPTTKMVIVGDSLAEQTAPVLGMLLPSMPAVNRYFGGTAPCDWVERDLDADRGSVVVVQFTGNSLTDCMSDGNGGHLAGSALVDAYRRDAVTIVRNARDAGAWVVLVGQPYRAPIFDADAVVDGINEVYRSLAANERYVGFVDAGAAVETPDGKFTDRLPCQFFDQQCDADGTTVVRGDGVHFCPVPDRLPCPVWSGGAFRFAAAIADAIKDPAAFD